ncbi:sigma factor [Pseudorhizobium tarimense]|uniref:sigma factor n=1 Tax=Pseudorhizobium tarimense TaxID=1079109 RepID=UPI001FF5263D|nr:sigma factor [Pseudorhizobium tarimense]MCJ8519095.1 hypothetical protein [Pseudorhizobium tarimense]
MEDHARPELHDEIASLIPALAVFARRFERSSQNAKDLARETLARALSNMDKLHEGTQLKSWLFTILRNTFCTRYQARTARTSRAGGLHLLSGCHQGTPGMGPPHRRFPGRAERLRSLPGGAGGRPLAGRELRMWRATLQLPRSER